MVVAGGGDVEEEEEDYLAGSNYTPIVMRQFLSGVVSARVNC